jgi:hypothetical protein
LIESRGDVVDACSIRTAYQQQRPSTMFVFIPPPSELILGESISERRLTKTDPNRRKFENRSFCESHPQYEHAVNAIESGRYRTDNRGPADEIVAKVAEERIEFPTRTIRFWFCSKRYPATGRADCPFCSP